MAGGDFGGKKLREPSVRSGLRAGDAKFFIRQHHQQRAAFRLHVNRFAHLENLARRFLREHARFLDQLDIKPRAAVADRRLVCVHLHDRVVHAHGRERREHMLDRMNAHRSLADGRRALDRFQILDPRVDRRLVRKILAFELDPGIDRRRLQLQRHLFARVQRGAADAGAAGESLLRLGRHEGLTNKDYAC